MVNCELYFVDSDLFIVRCQLRNVSCQKWTASEPVLEVSRGVLSRLGSVLTSFWSRLWGVLSRLGDVLETSWSLQVQPKIGFEAISCKKNDWVNVRSPSDRWVEIKSTWFGVSKAIKMEANSIQNWYKNSTSNKDSFTIPHRQVFERKLRPKSSTFLVDDIATRNII